MNVFINGWRGSRAKGADNKALGTPRPQQPARKHYYLVLHQFWKRKRHTQTQTYREQNFNLNKKTTSWSHFATFPCSLGLQWPLGRTSSHEAQPTLDCPALTLLCICNKYFFEKNLSWQNSPIVINCKCIKTSQGHFSMCIVPEKYYCLTGSNWQVKRGFIEGNSSSKQRAVHRKVIVPLILKAHVHLRGSLLPLPYPHPEDPLDKQPRRLSLGSSCQCTLAFFPFFWAKLSPQSSWRLPEWKLSKSSLLNCITGRADLQTDRTKSQIPKVWSEWLLSCTGWLPLNGFWAQAVVGFEAASGNLAEFFSS